MAHIKYLNSDFIVREVSLQPLDLTDQPSEKKQILISNLRKEGYTTYEALHIVANSLALPLHEVRCQGLKDEDGITQQLISINKNISQEVVNLFNRDNSKTQKGFIELLPVGYSTNHVQERCLHGNIFIVKVRGLTEKELLSLTDKIQNNRKFTYLNYYDSQRFGLPGGPYLTFKIGESLCKGDLEQAYDYYVRSGNVVTANPKDNIFLNRSIDVRQVRFFIDSYYSYIWNNKLSEYVSEAKHVKIFDGYHLPLCKAHSKIPCQLSCKSITIGEDWKLKDDTKTRETSVTTSVFILSSGVDEIDKSKYYIEITFMLPTGSYATMMLKQLLADCQVNDVIIGGD